LAYNLVQNMVEKIILMFLGIGYSTGSDLLEKNVQKLEAYAAHSGF